MSRPGSCRGRPPGPDRVEPLHIEGRRVLFAQHADARYERLTTDQRALLQRAIGTLLREPGRLQAYAGRPDASGRPKAWLLLMHPLLIEMGESGDDIVISRILITRDPLEPL